MSLFKRLVRLFIFVQDCMPLVLIVGLLTWQVASATHTKKLNVYVFLSTECPISQRYVPTLTELYQRFDQTRVQFIAFFPLRTDTPATIQRFRTEYKLPFPGQTDKHARFARSLQIRVTPEVVVMNTDGHVRYQGAIDDWYTQLGKHRSEATQHYLSNALDSLLAGRPINPSHTEAVGCLVE